MTRPKVIVDPHFRRMDEIFSPADRARLHDRVDVVWGQDDPMPEQAFLATLPEAEAVVCAHWRYGDVLDRAPNLRGIFAVSGGFPRELDYAACYERRIRVLSAAPAFARPVAELCLGLALAASRRIAAGDREMRRGGERYLHAGNVGTFMLFDQPVGIIGYGNIARALHPLLLPFNVKLAVYDPWLGEGFLRRQGVEPVALDRLLTEARVIFVLATATSENEAMLSREKLELIQPGAVLVLASRAHVVDFDALTKLVLAGRFKLATDVFPMEPLDADHPLRGAEEAVLTPHLAGPVREGLWEIGQMVVDDLEAVLAGLPPRRLQNAEPELSHRYRVNTIKQQPAK